MNRHRPLSALSALLVAGIALVAHTPAHADVVVDQSQTSQGGTLGAAVPWYQTFRPSLDNIVSVDLWTRADSGGIAGVELLDEPCGTVIASGQIAVVGTGVDNVPFDGGPIPLVPGQTYVLRFLPIEGDIQWWRGSPNNPYADGALHSGWWDQVCTDPYDEGQWDFMFRTYGESGFVPTEETTWTMVKAIYR